MSLATDIQIEGFRAQLEVAAETFQCLTLTAKPIFNGIINPAPGIDPRLELSYDVRELSTIQVLQSEYPQGIAQENLIQQISTSGQPIWRIVKREINPSDSNVLLWVVRVVPNTDQT